MPINGVGIVSTDAVGWDLGGAVGIEGESVLESLIYSLLLSATQVTTVVTTKIYCGQFPDKVGYPSVLFTRIIGEPQLYMTDRPNAQRATIQIDCFSTSYLTSFELSTAVHTVMQGSTTFKNIQLNNQDLSQPLNNNKMLYRISADYSCWYKT